MTLLYVLHSVFPIGPDQSPLSWTPPNTFGCHYIGYAVLFHPALHTLTFRQGNSNILYQAYFNDPNHKNIIRAAKVFSGIESYGVDGNYYKVSEFCDPSNIDSSCRDDETTQAYNTIYSDGSSRIVFCQSWFGLDDLDFCNLSQRCQSAALHQTVRVLP